MTLLTTQQKLEAITERICEVVPDRLRICSCDRCSVCSGKYNRRDPGLEDVLLALPMPIRHIATFAEITEKWKLGKPLSEQDPRTIDYLYPLLPSSK